MQAHRRLIMLTALSLWSSLASAATPEPTMQICHFPPGNPGNYQSITVGLSAVQAHLAHGDFPGPCANDCNLFANICNDANSCTYDACDPRTGMCLPPVPANCDDSNPCTTDTCVPAGVGISCQYVPDPAATCGDPNDVCYVSYCTATGQCETASVCEPAGCCFCNVVDGAPVCTPQ